MITQCRHIIVAASLLSTFACVAMENMSTQELGEVRSLTRTEHAVRDVATKGDIRNVLTSYQQFLALPASIPIAPVVGAVSQKTVGAWYTAKKTLVFVRAETLHAERSAVWHIIDMWDGRPVEINDGSAIEDIISTPGGTLIALKKWGNDAYQLLATDPWRDVVLPDVGPIYGVEFSADGRLMILKLWSDVDEFWCNRVFRTRVPYEEVILQNDHGVIFFELAFDQAGNTIIGNNDSLLTWDAHTGERIFVPYRPYAPDVDDWEEIASSLQAAERERRTTEQ